MNERTSTNILGLVFKSKCLDIANLNIKTFTVKVNGLRIALADEIGSDILGVCEIFLDPSISCSQLTMNGFDHLQKDRSEIHYKTGLCHHLLSTDKETILAKIS